MKLNLKKMKIVILCLLNIGACKENTPPVVSTQPSETKVVLTEEKKSCTELWLNLSIENFTLPVNVNLIKNNSPVIQINELNKNDTLLFIDSLIPGQTYHFTAIVTNPEQTDTGKILQVTTLDSTIHNFSYQTFEIGDPGTGNSSILWDVDIVDENNIWAVGEIYDYDSLGNTRLYNAAHWDGNQWAIKRVQTYFRNNLITVPLEGILTFSSIDIWMVGSLPIHGDGENWTMYDLRTSIDPNLSLSRVWGHQNNDIYFVGRSGSIAYYNDNSWSRIESGTEFDLTDVYGNNNGEIYSSGVNISEVKGVLLKGNSNQFSVMINSEIITENELFGKLYGNLAAVWVDENNTIYTGGNLLFSYKNNSWDYERSLPENFIGGNPGTYYRGFIASISGNGSNDYIIAGDRNTLKHFNGISWEQIGLPYDPQSPIIWRSVKMKNNIVVAVGDKGSRAFIILLSR